MARALRYARIRLRVPMKPLRGHRKPRRLEGLSYRGYLRYFITIRCYGFRDHFTNHETVTKTIATLRDSATQRGFLVWAYCFMPDHMHMLVEGQDAHADMKQFVALFKQKSAFWFRASHGDQLWAANYYEHVLRDDEATMAIAGYILENPVRKGILADYSGYPYSGSFELESIEDL